MIRNGRLWDHRKWWLRGPATPEGIWLIDGPGKDGIQAGASKGDQALQKFRILFDAAASKECRLRNSQPTDVRNRPSYC